MKAVGYRLLSQLRGRWAATLLLSLIAAVVCAVVITFAAGARRTTTVPARYADSVGGAFDAEVTQEEPGRPRTDEMRALPAVESADSYTFVFGGVVRPGADFPEDAISFTGLIEGLGAQLVSGRVPDPTAEGEFVASRSFMDAGDAQLGDQFTFRSFTQEQADASQFGNFEDAAGPSLPATLVGVIDSPEFIDQEGALLLFSPALLDRVDDGMGVSLSMTAIRLHDGSDTDELRTQLDSLPRSTGLSIGSGDYVSAEMHRAISTQGRGLWILAIVAGIAAVAVLGQLITRQVRLSLSERQQLTALGYTERQALIESLVRAGVPIVLGCLGGAGLAIACSGIFPTGFVRRLEPQPGVFVMWATLAASVAVVAGGLLLWTLGALALGRASRRLGRPSTVLEAITTRAASATAAVGVHFAFTRARAERGSVRASLVGVLLTVCGLVAAVTFGFSLDRLIDEPFRYGVNYDYSLGDNGGEEIAPELTAVLDTDPNVTSLVYYAQTFTRSGGVSLPTLGMRSTKGDGRPVLVSGRMIAGDDEIVLGRVTADDLDARIGDDVQLTGLTGTQTYRVVGIVVVPGFGSNEGVGEGGVVTFDGLLAVDEEARLTTSAVRFAPGSSLDAYAAIFGSQQPEDAFLPSSILSIARVKSVPFVLAAVLGALAVLTIAHGMITSLRARRHDVAVLRSLGADRGFVSRTVHWQATAFSIVPVLVGAPLGFIVGRLIFAAYARNLGAIDGATLPIVVLAGVVVGLVVLANAVATLSARGARRLVPARVLQAE